MKFAPYQLSSNSHFVQFGVPTLGQAMAKILFSTFSGDKGLDNLFEKNQQESTSTTTETGDDKKANSDTRSVSEILKSLPKDDATNNLMGAIEDAYSTVDEALGIVKNISQMFEIRIGQLRFTDLYIGNVKWEFDYQQVDSNGYPYKGTVELKNISTSRYTTQDYLNKVMPG